MKRKFITTLLCIAAAVSLAGCSVPKQTTKASVKAESAQAAQTKKGSKARQPARLAHMTQSKKFTGDYVAKPAYFEIAPNVKAAVLGRSGDGESFLYVSNESDNDISLNIKLKGISESDKKKTDETAVFEPYISKGSGRIESVTSLQAKDIKWDFEHAKDIDVKTVDKNKVKDNLYIEPDISYNLSNAGVTTNKQYFTLDIKNSSKKGAMLHGKLYFVLRNSRGEIQGIKAVNSIGDHGYLKAGGITETTFPVKSEEVKTPELTSGAIVYNGYFTEETRETPARDTASKTAKK